MDSQIKSITARLQETVQKKNYLDLRENVSGGELKSKSLKRLPSTSLVDLSYVCGRDNDKEEILKFLFSDKGCDEYGIVTSPGSRIIVTTRNQGVALMMSAFPSYHLKVLSFDDSLSLFAKHALGRPNFNDLPDLLEVGQQIVQRCRGLPMAVKTLGGPLAH
ncbi:hypothetical protein OIU78_018925 [Salix suchowensis]|nr:hypothetical protein OIU78_018925 [Salix suchowensis]